MNQRQSLPFKKPSRPDATLSMAAYMIEHSDVPIIFMDMDGFVASYEGEAKPNSSNLVLLQTQKEIEYITAMSNFIELTMETPAVAVIDETLCIIGKSSNYYVIDIYNEILYETESPEYEFPSNKVISVSFYGTETNVSVPIPQPVASANPPVAKKAKKTAAAK